MKKITKDKVYDALKKFAEQGETSPTQRQLAKSTKLSHSMVWIQMQVLKAEGKIDYDFSKSRTIKIL